MSLIRVLEIIQEWLQRYDPCSPLAAGEPPANPDAEAYERLVACKADWKRCVVRQRSVFPAERRQEECVSEKLRLMVFR